MSGQRVCPGCGGLLVRNERGRVYCVGRCKRTIESTGTTKHVPQDVLPAPASSSETRPGGHDETGPRA